jgi:molybdate transport system permease protein
LDWSALVLSLELASATAAILLPLAVGLGRVLAWRRFAGKAGVEALLALPLVLPPTVLGYYLLVTFAPSSVLGQLYQSLVGKSLAFSFEGLLVASVIANVPFAVQPVQRGFEAIATEVREAAWLCGMSGWRAFWRVELPLAWPGLLTAFVLTFAHTLGEFGVVLMVGGNLPGVTRTVSISIYDSVQALDYAKAGATSTFLLAVSFLVLSVTYALQRRFWSLWRIS